MNRTQKKAHRKQVAAVRAEASAARDFMRTLAAQIYSERGDFTEAGAHASIQAALTFGDALQTFRPASSPMPPREFREAVAAEDARLDAEGEGRELARDAVAEMLEPGSEAEMEALS